jgi:AcrR family transcriptional regulator
LSEARPRIRLTADARRDMIVAAAFEAIAREGFEGLRTRDIAAAVEINSATLHHHFPTKEHLVTAVAAELMRRFQSDKSPAAKSANARDALHAQFADARHYQTDAPDLLAVYREFLGRAPRDPLIAGLVGELSETWRSDIREILKQAKWEGILAEGADPDLCSHIVLNAIWGTLMSPGAAPLERIERQLLKLLFAKP